MAVGKAICQGFYSQAKKEAKHKQAQLVMQEQGMQGWGKASQAADREDQTQEQTNSAELLSQAREHTGNRGTEPCSDHTEQLAGRAA